MKIVLVSGSHRLNSQSSKVAKHMANELTQLGVEPDVIELAGNPIPLWDEGVWDETDAWKSVWSQYSNRLQQADAVVLVSPEWGGMVPPGLKNFLLLCSGGELNHKPVLITAVSAGMGGAYPVAELRMSGYKNSFMCYLPDHLIVRRVETVLNQATPENTDDERIRKRITYSLRLLIEYGKALKQVRESGVIDRKTYSTGM